MTEWAEKKRADQAEKERDLFESCYNTQLTGRNKAWARVLELERLLDEAICKKYQYQDACLKAESKVFNMKAFRAKIKGMLR